MFTTPQIVQLTRLVSALANGKKEEIEKEISQLSTNESDAKELNELRTEVLILAQKHLDAREFILNLSSGNLNIEAPRKNRLLDPFKELHANLKHLVWQTQQIEKGDFSQHVDFLGEFSDSFNSLVASLRDKQKLEEDLRKSENQYRKIFNNSIEGIFQTTVEGKLLIVNPAFAWLFGYDSPEEMMNLVENVTDQLYSNPEGRTELIKQLCKNGYVKDFELNFVKRDGKPFWVSTNSQLVRDENGEIICLEGTMVDITQRKQAEETVNLTSARLKRAELTSLTGNWELHLDSKIMIASEGAQAIYGIKAEQFDYSFLRTVPLPEFRPVLDAALKQLLEEGIPYDVDFKIKAVDSGVIKDIRSQAMYDKDKNVVFGVIQDITDHKRSEKALKESEASLRELVATKDKFFSIIAHDLKSPFNSIWGLSQLLGEQIKEKNYDGIEEYAELIQNSSELAVNLLKNLLEWARSQTGKMEFSPEYIEIVSLINETTKLNENSAAQKSITVLTELPRNMVVFADKAMLGTVLRNLISNAIKFTKQEGRIVISARQTSEEVMIVVSDNGVGLKSGEIGKLFRVDENHSTLGTENEKGTGLGLILCKEFIEKHGGKIWAESESGKGSTFYFTIPRV